MNILKLLPNCGCGIWMISANVEDVILSGLFPKLKGIYKEFTCLLKSDGARNTSKQLLCSWRIENNGWNCKNYITTRSSIRMVNSVLCTLYVCSTLSSLNPLHCLRHLHRQCVNKMLKNTNTFVYYILIVLWVSAAIKWDERRQSFKCHNSMKLILLMPHAFSYIFNHHILSVSFSLYLLPHSHTPLLFKFSPCLSVSFPLLP